MEENFVSTDYPVIEAAGIGKSYGSTVALDSISMKIMPGTIHGLLGENGAGKSTFLKILAGVTPPDRGEVSLKGEKILIKRPKDAVELGLISVFQELSLVPELTVAEALFLDDPPRNMVGRILYKKLNHDAGELLTSYGFSDITSTAKIKDLSLATRQVVEIIKCLNLKPEILFMDEGTSTLTSKEVKVVFDFLRHLKKGGKSVVFISHRMEEIREICDVYTVFRDGKNMGTFLKEEISDDELIELMIGEKNNSYHKSRQKSGDDVLLQTKKLSWEGALRDISLSIYKGEILGIGGLNGQGQTELLYSLFGILKGIEGEVWLNNRLVRMASPRRAMSGNTRVALIPEDRKTEGGIMEMTLFENLCLPVFCSRKKQTRIDLKNEIEEVFQKLNIKAPGLSSRLGALSGGNQQKVIIGKWLLTDADLYIFHDPTRGIDVKSKHDIYLLIEELASRGKSVILFSTELQELVWLCDAVAILYENKIRRLLRGDEINEKNILEATLAMDISGGDTCSEDS